MPGGNWRANRKNRIYLGWKQLTRKGARENQKPGHEGKHGLEHWTALNLETKVTRNNTGPGQTWTDSSMQNLSRSLGFIALHDEVQSTANEGHIANNIHDVRTAK